MRKKIAIAIAYPLFFVGCLILFLIWGFPVQLIQDRVALEIQSRLDLKMTTSSVSSLFPNGVEATGIKLIREGTEGSPKPLVRVDRLALRISLLAWLAGDLGLSFSSELLAGKLTGTLNLEDGHWELKSQIAGVDLGKLTIWPELIGQELTGKLTGSLELNGVPKDAKATQGEILLDLEQGQAGNGKIYGIALPAFGLGKTQINLKVQKGQAEIKAFKVNSDDIEANLDGYFLLQQKFKDLSAHCRIRARKFEEKLNQIRNQIPPEFREQFNSELDRAKGKDGWYRWSVFGRPFGGKLQFRPLKQ